MLPAPAPFTLVLRDGHVPNLLPQRHAAAAPQPHGSGACRQHARRSAGCALQRQVRARQVAVLAGHAVIEGQPQPQAQRQQRRQRQPEGAGATAGITVAAAARGSAAYVSGAAKPGMPAAATELAFPPIAAAFAAYR